MRDYNYRESERVLVCHNNNSDWNRIALTMQIIMSKPVTL